MTKLILTIPLPQLASVKAVNDLTVRVTWASGIRVNRTDLVDLSPLVKSLKFYRPLRMNASLFRTVHLIEGGTILAWGDDDEIDMAADSVEQLAEDSMTADDFRAFLKTNNLTHNDAAALLGYSRRQIENFLNDSLIPRVVAMACFGLTARKEQKAQRAESVQTSTGAQVNRTDTLPTISLANNKPATVTNVISSQAALVSQ